MPEPWPKFVCVEDDPEILADWLRNREAEFLRLQEEHRDCCAGAWWVAFDNEPPRWINLLMAIDDRNYRPFNAKDASPAEEANEAKEGQAGE